MLIYLFHAALDVLAYASSVVTGTDLVPVFAFHVCGLLVTPILPMCVV
jgi:hypothetical protein